MHICMYSAGFIEVQIKDHHLGIITQSEKSVVFMFVIFMFLSYCWSIA